MPNTYACSFCGKTRDQVQRLIAGPGGVFICDECVRLCNEIITDSPPPPGSWPSVIVRRTSGEPRARRGWLGRLLGWRRTTRAPIA